MKKFRMHKKKEETKEKIFQTALRLFLKQGFEKTTVDRIAEEADVAKGTFFNYFPTKDALLFYLGEKRLKLLDEVLERELENVPGAAEKILSCLRVLGQANEEDRDIVALVVMEFFKLEISRRAPEKEAQNCLKDRLAQIIGEGQKRDEFSAGFEPLLAADIFIGMYFSVLFQWLDGAFSGTLTEELTARAEIIMSGIKKEASWKS